MAAALGASSSCRGPLGYRWCTQLLRFGTGQVAPSGLGPAGTTSAQQPGRGSGNLLTDRAGPAGCLARDTVLAAALGQLEPAARATSAPDAAVQVHSRGLGGVEADAAESRDRDEMLTDGQGVLL